MSADLHRQRESFGDEREAAEFVQMLERFERGELSAEQYRHYRLSRGIYGQRQDGVQMVRVKAPQGVVTAEQLRVLADCAERYSRGFGHVTTRQNFQFHFVKTADAPPFMEAVARAGLTTREACSHTVRNVAACPYAGVCAGAPFDVTPYAEAVTRFFLRAPLGSGLPRKVKINASGCEDDCGRTAFQDIGFVARLKDGQRGFRFTAAGGTATLARSGGVLHDFLPAEHLLAACEAVLRVFNAEGNRKNVQRARLKWVIEKLGWEAFRARYQQEFDALLAAGGRPLPALPGDEQAPLRPAPNVRPSPPPPAAFARWRETNVRPQRQAGYSSATLWLRLGDLSSEQMRGVARLVEELGDGTVRLTLNQNLLARWVRTEHLSALWLGLDALGLGGANADTVEDVVSCPGAETCRIAVTSSRGVAQLLGDHLRARGVANGPAASADIKVSGCPNGCGQHHIAAIGLQGGMRKLGARVVPQYIVMLGGGVDGSGATFGRIVTRIVARRAPEAVDRLITHFEQNAQPGESPHAFFRRLEVAEAKALLADLGDISEASARPEDFVDLGSNVEFKVVTLDGECAA